MRRSQACGCCHIVSVCVCSAISHICGVPHVLVYINNDVAKNTSAFARFRAARRPPAPATARPGLFLSALACAPQLLFRYAQCTLRIHLCRAGIVQPEGAPSLLTPASPFSQRSPSGPSALASALAASAPAASALASPTRHVLSLRHEGAIDARERRQNARAGAVFMGRIRVWVLGFLLMPCSGSRPEHRRGCARNFPNAG